MRRSTFSFMAMALVAGFAIATLAETASAQC